MNKDNRKWFLIFFTILILVFIIILWENRIVFSTYKNVPKFSRLEVCSIIIGENNQEQISKCDTIFSVFTNRIIFRGKIDEYNEVSPPIAYIYKDDESFAYFFDEITVLPDVSSFIISIPLPEEKKIGLYRIILYSDRQIVGSVNFSIE